MREILLCTKHDNSRNRPYRQQDSTWSYLVCAGAAFCQAVNMGRNLSFGVLFPVIIKQFNLNRQESAWIGSLAIALMFFAGPLAARLTEIYSCRFVAIFGVLLSAVALLVTSFAENVIIYFFTYSLMGGFGSCCIRISSFLVIAKYFCKRKPLATGIVTASSSLGLFIFAPLTQVFLDNYGLQNTFRIFSGIVLCSGICTVTFDPYVEETDTNDSGSKVTEQAVVVDGKRKFMDCSLWRVPTFTVFALAYAMYFTGKTVPNIHLVKYAQEQGISFAPASRLLMYDGLSSCIARIVTGFVCNVKFINPCFVYQAGAFTTALSFVLFTAATSYSWFALFSVFSGLGKGITIMTSNLILLTCVDNERRATAFGLVNCLASFAHLASPPFAGFLADKLETYAPAFYFAAAALLVCSLLPFLLLCIKVHKPLESEDESNQTLAASGEEILRETVC